MEVRLDRLTRRPKIDRACTALAPVQQVETDVRGDAIEPRTQACSALEAIEATPGAQERLLYGVLRLERRGEHAVAIGGQLPAMLLEPALELFRRDAERRFLHGAHRTC